jgi:hypothetical protein
MFIVEMHRVPRPEVGYDNLDCPGPHWDALLELGQAFGWQPRGILQRSKEDREGYRRMRYIPGMYGEWLPEVDQEDAKAWAEALDRAANHMEELGVELPRRGPYLISEGVTPEMHEAMNGGVSAAFVRTFSEYLHRGAFDCAYDD